MSLSQTIQWHITESCPNHCTHCYIESSSHNKSENLEYSQLLKILDNLQNFEERYHVQIDTIDLTGGDPFAHKDFEKLLAELSSRNKSVIILGIPERITFHNLEMLQRYNVVSYQISLDGMSQTHDRIRGLGSFNRTISAIIDLSASKKLSPHVMFTLHNENYMELFPLIEYLDKLNVSVSFSFDFLVFEGHAKNGFQLLNKELIDSILQRYHQKKLQLKKEERKLILREKVKLFETFSVNDVANRFEKYSYISGCSCGISGAAILPNGDLLACRRLPIKIGNLLEDSYETLFLNHPLMRKLRRITSFSYCKDCDYAKVCRGCPALVYSCSGDPFGEMPYCAYKKVVAAHICEPSLTCSSDEEFAYLTNNLKCRLQKEDEKENRRAILFDLYKEYFLESHSYTKNP